MKKVYFAGSIRGGRDDAKLYFKIIEYLQSLGYEVLTEHVGLHNLQAMGEQNMTEEDIYKRDMGWLQECDIVVAEVTQASLGVGYEIAMAENWDKPTLCLYRSQPGRSLSAMIAGSPHATILRYETLDEAKQAIADFLSAHSQSYSA